MIGVFDSGVGGLTALKELCARMPHEDYIYLADSAHLPYGSLLHSDITRHTARACSFLREKGADCVLLACGTASATALGFCRRSFPIPIYDVLEPSVLAAKRITKSHRIGVAATEATVKSGAVTRLFNIYDPMCEPICVPCPSLVQLIEASKDESAVCYEAVRASFAPLRDAKVDTVILGCTHFAWLRPYITAFLPNVELIESGKEGAIALCDTLLGCAPKQTPPSCGTLSLYTTASQKELSERAEEALQRKVKVKTISKDII